MPCSSTSTARSTTRGVSVCAWPWSLRRFPCEAPPPRPAGAGLRSAPSAVSGKSSASSVRQRRPSRASSSSARQPARRWRSTRSKPPFRNGSSGARSGTCGAAVAPGSRSSSATWRRAEFPRASSRTTRRARSSRRCASRRRSRWWRAPPTPRSTPSSRIPGDSSGAASAGASSPRRSSTWETGPRWTPSARRTRGCLARYSPGG